MGRVRVRDSASWEAAKADLRALLVDAARSRTTVTYSHVAFAVFGGRVPARSRLIMDLLGEVDDAEFARTGTIIASLVVRADSGIPGAGYFAFIAERFGRDVSDPAAAWRIEAERVWEAYAETAPADTRDLDSEGHAHV